MNEIWKEIDGSFYYAVSNTGKIKRLEHKKWCKVNNSFSTFKEKSLTPNNKNTKKYWRIAIFYKNGTKIYESIHRLVAKMFVDNPNNYAQVNHIDGDKNNNNNNNLEWCTNLYNMRHSHELGLRKNSYNNMIGEKCHMNKYSEKLIRKIPILIEEGLSYTQVAIKLKIPKTLITEIKKGRAWKSLNLTIPDSEYCKKKI